MSEIENKKQTHETKIFSEYDSILNCDKENLIEYHSSITINGKRINNFQNNVIDYLYGNKYGKATFKKIIKY